LINPSCSTKRFPHWLKKNICGGQTAAATEDLLKNLRLHTICESGRCPNRNECYSDKTATFLILGNSCTRNCRFCSVGHGQPAPCDPEEPVRVVEAARRLGLRHVVVTSVTRDDLLDEGAGAFAAVVCELKKNLPPATVEVLTPDFKRNQNGAVRKIMEAGPDVFNHNCETVPALYPSVRPEGDYQTSLGLLKRVKEASYKVLTKSGLMLGLGETREQVLEVLSDLKASGCDLLTLGQYLKPSQDCLPVAAYIAPEVFQDYKDKALAMGFFGVQSGPFVRSSYHAGISVVKRTNF
jgi:lipoic acid synthetase